MAELRSGSTTYYQADGLGSITSLTNPSATIAASYGYDAFGNLSTSSGSLTNSFRHGREFDRKRISTITVLDTTTQLGRFTAQETSLVR